MQLLEQGGVKYIHRLAWHERAYICSLFKNVKTYDYVYLQPTDSGVDILAIKARSIVTRYSLPDEVPGVICVQLTPFNTINEKTITDTILENKSLRNFPINPDFILPSLDDCLSKYLFLCQDPQQYLLDSETNCIIYSMSYHMVNRILNSYGTINYYKMNSADHILLPDFDIENFRSIYTSLRADDGGKIIQVGNQYMITIFAGMIPLNKADGLEIHIYDSPIDNKFLVQYIVLKKKQTPIEINIFHMKL